MFVTATIQIGNSDDKLPQVMWSEFHNRASREIESHARKVHFAGASDATKAWQNACWVVEIAKPMSKALQRRLRLIRKGFSQDSIAYTEGSTELI